MRTSILLALSLFLIIVPSYAKTEKIPNVITNGFSQYAETGPKAAIEAWTKGGAMEGSKDALSQANNFRQIQDFYGNYIGYEIVKENEISKSTSVYLINILYEKGNVFSTYHTYKLQDGKVIVNNFNFHTKAEVIWPERVLFGE
jgi:hypothetical protein